MAGTAIDRLGARAVLPAGALLTGIGACLFATSDVAAAHVGRLKQGAGGAFGLVGAVYIASNNFPASRVATLTGAAQMFGMAGGSAGWSSFWVGTGVIGILIAAALFVLLPAGKGRKRKDESAVASLSGLVSVFKNPQSIICGVIAGLLFIPTTIFDMIWGVRYLQEARGFEYGDAVVRSATVPLGWIIGCPLLGFLSDRLGRRKPVIIGGLVCCWDASCGSCMARPMSSLLTYLALWRAWRPERRCSPTR